MILEPKKIKSVTVSTVCPSICYEVMERDAMIFVFGMLSFKAAFSLSLSTFIKRFFSSSLLAAIWNHRHTEFYLRNHTASLVVPIVKKFSCNSKALDSVPGLGRYPGKGMATHSSILAWRIPRTEESGRLQSTGSQRVGHNCMTNTFTFMPQCRKKYFLYL